jgi:two-component system, sensor histidine kinase and response regulator
MKDLFARLISNEDEKGDRDHPNTPHRLHFNKIEWLRNAVLVVSAIAIIAIAAYIDQLNNHNYQAQARVQADNSLKIIAARLEGNILGNLQTAKAMVSAVNVNPAIDQAGFAEFAKPLFDGSAQLRNISGTRNLKLLYMYPLEGNESAVGFDYRNRADQLKDLLRARQSRKAIISGPFELIQGGQGLIARLPVVLENSTDKTAELWGTISAVIDLQSLYDASGLLETKTNLNIAIRKITEDSSAVFFGNMNGFYAESHPVITAIQMPSGDKWELAAIPKNGWPLLAKNASTLRIYLIFAGITIFSMIIVISHQINRRQRNNLLLRSLFDLSPNGIALSDFSNGAFLQVNDALLSSTGYTREEFITLNYWQLSATNKDEAEQYQTRALLKNGRYGPYERNYIRKDGTEFPVRLSGVLIRDDSGKSFVWSIIENISAQKKTAEIMQRQQSLMRSMGAQARVGAWEYIVGADKTYWSEMTRKIFKVSDSFIPSHENLKKFYHTKETLQRINRAMSEAISDGVPFSEEIRIRTENGHDTWIQITGQAEFSQNKCIRVYGSTQDIDSRRKVRDELIDAKEKAEAAVHAKSEFLAVMSHEIRTPMNGVLGMLNLLENSKLDTDQNRKVHIAKTSAQSLLNLINDILDFSKVDAGKLQLENIVFNIRNLFDDIAASQALNAQEKDLELIIDQSAINQSWVSGDPARLRQIITNLLANAIKFTSEGNIILRAGLRSKHGQLLLNCAITDTGIGIPNSEMKRLFTPFTQIDASTTRKFGGSGLGLSICKNLCELMGGSISVASTYNEGSTFTFSVILQEGNSKERIEQTPSSMGKRRYFIIDENTEFTAAIGKQLQQWGVNISPIEHSEELLREIPSASDAATSDIIILGVRKHSIQTVESLIGQLRQHSVFKNSVIILASNIDIANINIDTLDKVNACYLKPLSYIDLTETLKLTSDTKTFKSPRSIGALTKNKDKKAKGNTERNIHNNTLKHEEFSKYRVLLVEDNPVNQEVGRCTLDELGVSADIAENGSRALEMLNNTDTLNPYSLILLDCQMPEMDGYQVCKYIRKGRAGDIYRDVPVIALTANAMSGDKEKCMSAGMNDYLSKPFTPNELVEILRKWLPEISLDAQTPPKASTDLTKPSSDIPMWVSAKALDSAMGRPDVLKKLLHLFCEQIESQIKQADLAYEKSNLDEISSIAHAVKGSAGQLHGMQLHKCATELEKAASSGDSAAINKLYHDFTSHAQNLARCFESYLQDTETASSKTELI